MTSGVTGCVRCAVAMQQRGTRLEKCRTPNPGSLGKVGGDLAACFKVPPAQPTPGRGGGAGPGLLLAQIDRTRRALARGRPRCEHLFWGYASKATCFRAPC